MDLRLDLADNADPRTGMRRRDLPSRKPVSLRDTSSTFEIANEEGLVGFLLSALKETALSDLAATMTSADNVRARFIVLVLTITQCSKEVVVSYEYMYVSDEATGVSQCGRWRRQREQQSRPLRSSSR